VPTNVGTIEGALNLPNCVAWIAKVFDLELLKGPYAPSEEELMTAL
jgi:hypothetical protein